jgi:hypothetical protein
MTDVTRVLSAIQQGDPRAAEQLLPLVYDELHKLAAQRVAQGGAGWALRATALAHKKISPRPHNDRPPYALI